MAFLPVLLGLIGFFAFRYLTEDKTPRAEPDPAAGDSAEPVPSQDPQPPTPAGSPGATLPPTPGATTPPPTGPPPAPVAAPPVPPAPAPDPPVAAGPPGGGVRVPTSGAYWGIYRDPYDYGVEGTVSGRQKVLLEAEAIVGRKFDLDRQFYRWGSALPNPYLRWTAAQGRIPVISLKAKRLDGGVVGWRAIANGAEDQYLNETAKQLAAWGRPAFFAFHHEPEGEICPNNRAQGCNGARFNGTTEDYKAAWTHIVQLFRSRGVTQLSYLWVTTGYRFSDPSDYRYGPSLYPGSAIIDWVASDPYNYLNGAGPQTWKSLREIIGPWYQWGLSSGKPMMFGEFGSLEDPANPARRAAWLDEAARDIKTSFPALKALCYFDASPPGNDTRLFAGTPASTASYRAWGLDPYFNP